MPQAHFLRERGADLLERTRAFEHARAESDSRWAAVRLSSLVRHPRQPRDHGGAEFVPAGHGQVARAEIGVVHSINANAAGRRSVARSVVTTDGQARL